MVSRIGKLHLTAVGLKCGLIIEHLPTVGREHDIGQFCEDLSSHFSFCLEWTVSLFASEDVQLLLHACEVSFDKCLLQ